MSRRLLLSGDRKAFTAITFDEAEGKISIDEEYPAPFNASWIEPITSKDDIDHLVGLSEGVEAGSVYTFDIDNNKKTCSITSQQPTLGAPGHFIITADKSSLALITYLGGSIALYPIRRDDESTFFLDDVPRTEVLPEFPYKAQGTGPDATRQGRTHPHQVLQDKQGYLYAPDLGSDRIWIFRQKSTELEQVGWLQCPKGSGSRHAAFSHDERLLYVIGELSHCVNVFDVSGEPADNVQPLPEFEPNIIPDSVDREHQSLMDSAEICVHPQIKNVLYVSNRWELHIAEREPHLENIPKDTPMGDCVAIIQLSADGTKVDKITQVRTGVDTIRGMRVTDDGQFVVVAGQESGGIEVYRISGERGDKWILSARLGLESGIESGIKHVIWL